MTILVGRSRSREGTAAFTVAVAEARLRGQDLVVFDLDRAVHDEEVVSGSQLDFPTEVEGVSVSYRLPNERSRDAVGDLLDTAEALDPSLIIIGIRHRSSVGKFLLGSSAQQILLQANAPVLAVKAEYSA